MNTLALSISGVLGGGKSVELVWEVVMLNVHSTSKAELLNFQTVKNAYFCISFRLVWKIHVL